MKNLLLIFVLALAVGGGGWYVWQGWNKPAIDLTSGNLDLPELEKLSEAEKLPEVPVSANDDKPVSDFFDLKALALKIISRPIVVTAPISERSKNDVLVKLDEFIKLIKENYDYPYAWYDLGAYRKLIGDYIGAVEAYQFVVQIRPQDPTAYINLGDLYGFYLKDYEKSEQSFLSVINIDPANINAYRQLATIYEYRFKEKAMEAENIFLLGIKFNPREVSLKVLLGQYYERQGRLADALKYFEEALKLDPKNQSLKQDIDRLKAS